MGNFNDGKDNFSLEDFMTNPPDNMEWVDGRLIEKNGGTLKHSEIQSNLAFYWKSYLISSGQGGKVYINVPCRTNNQARRPDVAYLTVELVEKFGRLNVLPLSFPLIAEIVSPTDLAENLFLKAQEYLESGCLEVWLVFPDSRLVLVITKEQVLSFTSGQIVKTQKVLLGFSVAIHELFGLENVSQVQILGQKVNEIVVNKSSNDTCKTVEEVPGKIEKLYSEEEVYERVKKVVSEELKIDINDITPTYCFANVDALDLIGLIIALEEEFDIEISDEDLDVIFKCDLLFLAYSSSFSSSNFYNCLSSSCSSSSFYGPKNNHLDVLGTVQDIVDYIKQKI